jgi:hypothetical protein
LQQFTTLFWTSWSLENPRSQWGIMVLWKQVSPIPGSIFRNISAILKFTFAPVFLSKTLRSISSKNSAYQAWGQYYQLQTFCRDLLGLSNPVSKNCELRDNPQIYIFPMLLIYVPKNIDNIGPLSHWDVATKKNCRADRY